MPHSTQNEPVLNGDIACDLPNGTDLKAKAASKHVELEAKPKPPVADDYMYDFKYNAPLPTSDVLGVSIPEDCDAHKEALDIVNNLENATASGDASAFADMFLENGT